MPKSTHQMLMLSLIKTHFFMNRLFNLPTQITYLSSNQNHLCQFKTFLFWIAFY